MSTSATAEAEAPSVAPLNFVGAAELAKILEVGHPTILRWVASGRLPKPARIGHALRWPRVVIDKFVSDMIAS